MPRLQIAFGALRSSIILNYSASYTFNYHCSKSDECEPFEVQLVPGTYRFECWGASGGKVNTDGGYGGYVSGLISIEEPKAVYLYIGGEGSSNGDGKGGYNGGGYATSWAAGGGGGTDIRLVKGEWNDTESLLSRIIVAGGGAGSNDYSTTVGNAGGLSGTDGFQDGSDRCGIGIGGKGGTQISGGSGSIPGSFGKGGSYYEGSIYFDGSGGGGGYFGGGKASGCRSTGGGGSSFISGHNGCIAVQSINNDGYVSMKEDSYHISGLFFNETIMKSGNEMFPSPIGEIENGHQGNGAIRITLLSSLPYICSIRTSITIIPHYVFILIFIK